MFLDSGPSPAAAAAAAADHFSGDSSSSSKPSPAPQELTLSYLCDNNNNNNKDPAFRSHKGKEIAADDPPPLERDFLQLATAAPKRDATPSAAGASDAKKPKIESLNLSLSLDAAPAPAPLRRAYSGNTAANSDDYTAPPPSMSYSYSLPFSHNPSCSLTAGDTNDQIWHAGEGTNGSVHSRFKPLLSTTAEGGNGNGNTNNIAFANSVDYPSNNNNNIYRTNSSDNLSFFPSKLPARPVKANPPPAPAVAVVAAASSDSNRHAVLARPDRVLGEIIMESVPIMAQKLQEFSNESVDAVKECLRNFMGAPEKKDDFGSLQRRLERRSDLTVESLAKAHRVQVEVFVAIKTGIASYLSGKPRIATKELVEIFLQSRCRNVQCRNQLPVDDCDCKICSTKKGFCSACTCPVCMNFDCASNTCGWVGCDLCNHWCHAVCGIEKNLIRPTPTQKGGPGMTEMQFRCLGCGHNSEMFGFVKEVFQCCAKDWGLETLMKELDCVIKIFRGSEDFEGKELQRKAEEIRTMLGKKLITPADACSGMLQFFKYGASDFSVTGSSSKKVITAPAIQQGDILPLPPPPPPPTITPLKSTFNLKPVNSILNTQIDALKTDTKPLASDPRFNLLKEDGFQSLETTVKFKEAEAKLFQRLADDARREEEGYRQIVHAKTEQLEEEYASKLAKLCLQETEERRRQKLEELKFLENSHCDYQSMKMRMQAEIAGLLERMEATKKQWV